MKHLTPSASLLVKLGSCIIHAEEALSPDAHAYDLTAFRQLLNDPEVREWFTAMSGLAFLPVKRKVDG